MNMNPSQTRSVESVMSQNSMDTFLINHVDTISAVESIITPVYWSGSNRSHPRGHLSVDSSELARTASTTCPFR